MGLWKCGVNHNLMLNIFFIGSFINFFMTSFWYFAFTAQTFIEYSKCFYYMMSALLALIWYFIYIFQREKYAQAFVDLDILIEKSKSTIEFE